MIAHNETAPDGYVPPRIKADVPRWLSISRDLLLITPDGQEQSLIRLGKDQRYRLGVISLLFPMLANKTVIENLCIGPVFHGKATYTQAKRNTVALLEKVALAHTCDSLPFTLDEQTRLKLCLLRCVLNDNPVIILENPSPDNYAAYRSLLDSTRSAARLWCVCGQSRTGTYDGLPLTAVTVTES